MKHAVLASGAHAQQSASNFTVQDTLFLVQACSLIHIANALNPVCVCVCVLKWAVVEVCCGLAVVTDGNVLSRSHEELQLLNKTGSAVTALRVCLSLLENSFSLFPFTTLPRHNLDTSVHGFYTGLCV